MATNRLDNRGDGPLPAVDRAAVARLTAWLRGRSWSQRPAQATASALALMVRLWADRRPFPTRQAVADHLGVSVPTVDLVLRRHKNGDLLIVYEGGAPVLRGKRWVVPSDEIVAVAGKPEPVAARRITGETYAANSSLASL